MLQKSENKGSGKSCIKSLMLAVICHKVYQIYWLWNPFIPFILPISIYDRRNNDAPKSHPNPLSFENATSFCILCLKVKVKVTQLWTPWTIQSIEFSRPEYWSWVAFPFSRGSSQPRDQIQVSRITGRFFTSWAVREAKSPLKWNQEAIKEMRLRHISA